MCKRRQHRGYNAGQEEEKRAKTKMKLIISINWIIASESKSQSDSKQSPNWMEWKKLWCICFVDELKEIVHQFVFFSHFISFVLLFIAKVQANLKYHTYLMCSVLNMVFYADVLLLSVDHFQRINRTTDRPTDQTRWRNEKSKMNQSSTSKSRSIRNYTRLFGSSRN